MFCKSTTSSRRKTPVAPSPIPAAPAIPSIVSGRVHNPGSMLTAARPTSTIKPQTMVSTGPASSRDATEKSSTSTASMRPSLTDPATIAGTAVRSWSLLTSAVEVISAPRVVGNQVYRGRCCRAKGSLGCPCKHDCEVAQRPREERPIHTPLVLGWAHAPVSPEPRHQDSQPSQGCKSEYGPAPLFIGGPLHLSRRPGKQGEGENHARHRQHQAPADANNPRQSAIAPAGVLLYLIDLGKRIERSKERTKRQQHQAPGRTNGSSRRRPAGIGRQGSEADHVDEPVDSRHGLEPKRRDRVQ